MRIEINKINPINEKIFVEPIREETKTNSGIILTVSTPEKTDLAKIVASDDDPSFRVGRVVLYDKFAVTPINEDLLAINKDDVFAFYGEE